MNSPTEEARLIEFGKQVRERRKALGMTIRKLAAQSNVSPSYLSAIESGRNPATGRPPEPSIGVVERLNSALGISKSVFDSDLGHCGGGCQDNHALLYRLDDGKTALKDILAQAFGHEVDQWICISDPRQIQDSDDGMISWHWPFGSMPYPDNFLVPDRIGNALDTQIESITGQITSENYGLVIADCSAVMRWVINPDAEVDYEDRWIERSTEIFNRHIGRAPAANVCVYSHRDLEALAKQIDVLDTVLRLFSTHSKTIAVDHTGQLLTGSKAIAAVLADSRPGGVSANAWRSLSGAVAARYAV